MISTETKVLGGVLVGTIILIIGGAFLSTKNVPTNRSTSGPTATTATTVSADKLVRDTSSVDGPTDAKVTVVEFGDFQCPACGAAYPIIERVKADYKEQSVRFVYRHFPLSQHEFAPLAAEASIAAQAQGKFWEYANQLYTHQNNLTRADLEKYATAVGLDLDKFKKALDDHSGQVVVKQDQSDGESIGIQSTPSFFINGKLFPPENLSEDGLKAVIDPLLK